MEEEETNNSLVENNFYENEYEGYENEYGDTVQYEMFNTAQSIARSGPKPYPCQHCNKTFANPQSLQKHTKSHTGETFCNICSKNFSTVPNLRVHMQSVHRS